MPWKPALPHPKIGRDTISGVSSAPLICKDVKVCGTSIMQLCFCRR